MKRYVIYDITSGNVEQVMSWRDNRDFPANYVLTENQAVKTITDNSIIVDSTYRYNSLADTFEKRTDIVAGPSIPSELDRLSAVEAALTMLMGV